MILSIPTLSHVTSTNLSDSTEVFSDDTQKTWYEGDEVQHDDKIYIATEDITVQEFNPLDTTYKAGNLIHVDGEAKTQVIYSTVGETTANPSEYADVDTSVDFADWTERFMRLPSLNFTVTPSAGPDLLYTFEESSGSMIVTVIADEASPTVHIQATVPIHTMITSSTSVGKVNFHYNPNTTEDIWVPVFVFRDGSGVYIRTDETTAEETVFKEGTYLFRDVVTPTDTSFTYLQETNNARPFDGSNYTKSYRTASDMQYTIVLDEPSNMFVLGFVKGTKFSYTFSDGGGSGVNIPIDGTRDESGVLSDWYTTVVIYADTTVPTNGTLQITIDGDELGTFMSGAYVDAGMSTLSFKSGFKDFSTFEYDPWGNPQYIDRAKVMTYSGTVDIPIAHYDRLVRLMSSLGKNIVIVDGSDNTDNDASDSENVFASTQFVGRTMAWNQQTKIKNKDMDAIATYSFTFEEIV